MKKSKHFLVITFIALSAMTFSHKLVSNASVFNNNELDQSSKIAPIETSRQTKIIQPVTINQENQKVIYYHFNNENSNYNNYWKKAINRWNKLNVVELVEAKNNAPKATIQLQDNTPIRSLTDQYNHQMASNTNGLAHTDYNYDTSLNINYVYSSTGSLTDYCINKYANYPKMLTNVATHELGHLLGFSHDDQEVHIQSENRDFYSHLMMNSVNLDCVKPLGDYEKRTLAMLYQK